MTSEQKNFVASAQAASMAPAELRQLLLGTVDRLQALKDSQDRAAQLLEGLTLELRKQAVQIRLLERRSKGDSVQCRPKVRYRVGLDGQQRKYILCPETPGVCTYLRSDHMKDHLIREHRIPEDTVKMYKAALPDYFGSKRESVLLASNVLRENPNSSTFYTYEKLHFSPYSLSLVYYNYLTSFKGRHVIRGGEGRENAMRRKYARLRKNVIFKILNCLVTTGVLEETFTIGELAVVLYEWALRGDAFCYLAANCGWGSLYLSTVAKKMRNLEMFVVYIRFMFAKVLDTKLLSFLSGTIEIAKVIGANLQKESEMARTEKKVNKEIQYPSLDNIKTFVNNSQHTEAMSFLEKVGWKEQLLNIEDKKALYKRIGQNLCLLLLALTGLRPDCLAGLRIKYFTSTAALYDHNSNFCTLKFSDSDVKAKIAYEDRVAVAQGSATEEMVVITIPYYMYVMLSRYGQMRLIIDKEANQESFLFVTPVRMRRLKNLARYIRPAWGVSGYSTVSPYHFRRAVSTHIRSFFTQPVFRNYVAQSQMHSYRTAEKTYNLILSNKSTPSEIKDHDKTFKDLGEQQTEIGRKIAALVIEHSMFREAGYNRQVEVATASGIALVKNQFKGRLLSVEEIIAFYEREMNSAGLRQGVAMAPTVPSGSPAVAMAPIVPGEVPMVLDNAPDVENTGPNEKVDMVESYADSVVEENGDSDDSSDDEFQSDSENDYSSDSDDEGGSGEGGSGSRLNSQNDDSSDDEGGSGSADDDEDDDDDSSGGSDCEDNGGSAVGDFGGDDENPEI